MDSLVVHRNLLQQIINEEKEKFSLQPLVQKASELEEEYRDIVMNRYKESFLKQYNVKEMDLYNDAFDMSTNKKNQLIKCIQIIDSYYTSLVNLSSKMEFNGDTELLSTIDQKILFNLDMKIQVVLEHLD